MRLDRRAVERLGLGSGGREHVQSGVGAEWRVEAGHELGGGRDPGRHAGLGLAWICRVAGFYL